MNILAAVEQVRIETIDPRVWADAIMRVGWPVFALGAWWILWRYWPWRKGTPS